MSTENNTDSQPKLYKYFRAAIKINASDLHIKTGQPPRLRVFGQLKDTTGGALSSEKIKELVFEILSEEQQEHFLRNGTLDFAYELGNDDRFRINIYRQRGFISLAARRVSVDVPSLEQLHLPAVIEKIAKENQGLILVTGPTGCGKTTSIAAIIDHINSTRSCHIVTIEDPIEYLFKDKKSFVSQREIGIDVEDFELALKYLMRQDPDVVLIGEMRDANTVTAAIRAAETGHLVLGTLHSANVAQAVQRLVDLFPTPERNLARQALALTIKAIINQRLLPCVEDDIDRIPAVEVLLANAEAKKLISESREADLPSLIRTCQEEGMVDLTDYLCKLVLDGKVEPQDAYEWAPNADELKMALKGVRSATKGIL